MNPVNLSATPDIVETDPQKEAPAGSPIGTQTPPTGVGALNEAPSAEELATAAAAYEPKSFAYKALTQRKAEGSSFMLAQSLETERPNSQNIPELPEGFKEKVAAEKGKMQIQYPESQVETQDEMINKLLANTPAAVGGTVLDSFDNELKGKERDTPDISDDLERKLGILNRLADEVNPNRKLSSANLSNYSGSGRGSVSERPSERKGSFPGNIVDAIRRPSLPRVKNPFSRTSPGDALTGADRGEFDKRVETARSERDTQDEHLDALTAKQQERLKSYRFGAPPESSTTDPTTVNGVNRALHQLLYPREGKRRPVTDEDIEQIADNFSVDRSFVESQLKMVGEKLVQ